MQCPSRGHENPAHARFCGACGVPIEADENSIPAPPPVEPPSEIEYVRFSLRLAAWLIDGLVLWLGMLGLAALSERSYFVYIDYATPFLAVPSTLAPWLSVLTVWEVVLNPLVVSDEPEFFFGQLFKGFGPLTYYVFLIGLSGQTAGKAVMRVRVINVGRSRTGFIRAAVRETLGKSISSIFLIIGYFRIAFVSNKQGWHDQIARTYVVRTRS